MCARSRPPAAGRPDTRGGPEHHCSYYYQYYYIIIISLIAIAITIITLRCASSLSL